jgi:hypothetical protein
VKFVKKPVTVDAWAVTDLIDRFAQGGVDALPEPIAAAYDDGRLEFPSPFLGDFSVERIDVITLEGIMQANHGWWLVLGTRGELYPVRADAFRDTFSPVGRTDTLDKGTPSAAV